MPGDGSPGQTPVRPVPAAPTAAEQRADALRVLVVDDSMIFRVGMCRAVEACDGLELLGEADGGQAALRAIDELAPDVVIMDWRMPDLDGIEVLRRLREAGPTPCRVLLVSATLDDVVEAQARAAGAARCLSKAESRADICAAALGLS